MKLAAYIRLFRLEHAFMLCIAVLLGQLLFAGQLAPAHLLLASLAVPLFLQMASFALNDFLDQATDRENKRMDRPLAAGEISPSFALYSSAACFAAGIFAASFLPHTAFLISVAFAVFSVLYNFVLKDLPLVGNVYIALSMAIPFVFGNLVLSDQIDPKILSISAVAFVAGLGREIVKSAEDVKGDVLHRKSRTLPALIGIKKSCILAAILYFSLLPLSFIPFLLGLHANLLSVLLVASCAFFFSVLAVQLAVGRCDFASARKTSLWLLFVGLAGYAASLL
ncbi:MAG: UbiA family prenyltransferase [Candidatus Anstonellaceae archaeon]